MSLPLAFKTEIASIPSANSYIVPPNTKIDYWKQKLSQYTQPKVGLVWSGGYRPDQPELWRVNEQRNIPLAILSQLCLKDFVFFSLQKGKEAEEEYKTLQSNDESFKDNFHDFTSELNDFNDTAALIMNLDLVISVDTSTAHLAGAIGKPVWVLNRFNNCWRWLDKGSDTKWYPSMKIYRQSSPGAWMEVIDKVKMDLIEELMP
jgi:hypothetical protein